MWDEKKEYDRMGLEEQTSTLLGVPFRKFACRSIPDATCGFDRSAALNQRLRQQGIHSARELNDRLIQKMSGHSGRTDRIFPLRSQTFYRPHHDHSRMKDKNP